MPGQRIVTLRFDHHPHGGCVGCDRKGATAIRVCSSMGAVNLCWECLEDAQRSLLDNAVNEAMGKGKVRA